MNFGTFSSKSRLKRSSMAIVAQFLLGLSMGGCASISGGGEFERLMASADKEASIGNTAAARAGFKAAIARAEKDGISGLPLITAVNKEATLELKAGEMARARELFKKALVIAEGDERSKSASSQPPPSPPLTPLPPSPPLTPLPPSPPLTPLPPSPPSSHEKRGSGPPSSSDDTAWLLEKHCAFAGLADVHSDTGHYRMAETFYKKAMDVEEQLAMNTSDPRSCSMRYAQMLQRETTEATVLDDAAAARLKAKREAMGKNQPEQKARMNFRTRLGELINESQKVQSPSSCKQMSQLLKEAENSYGPRTLEYRLALTGLIGCYDRAGKIDDCIKLVERDMARYAAAEKVQPDWENSAQVEDARFLREDLFWLGQRQRAAGRPVEAEKTMERCVNLTTLLIGPKDMNAAYVYEELAAIRATLGKKDQSCLEREKVLRIIEANHISGERLFAARNQLARSYEAAGLFQKALEQFRIGMEEQKRIDPHTLLVADNYNGMGRCQSELGLGKESIESFKSALPLCRKSGNFLSVYVTLEMMAKSAQKTRDIQALAFACRELEKELSSGKSKDKDLWTRLSIVTQGLCDLYEQVGNLDKAEEVLKKCIPYLDKSGNKGVPAASVINRIATIENRKGHKQEAIRLFKEGVRRCETYEPNVKESWASSLIQLSLPLWQAKRYDEALKTLEKARVVARGEKRDVGASFEILTHCLAAGVLNDRGERAKALAEHQAARRLAERYERQRRTRRKDVYIEVARSAERLGLLDESAFWFEKIRDGYEKRNVVDGFRVIFLNEYCALLRRQNKTAEAEKLEKENGVYKRKLGFS